MNKITIELSAEDRALLDKVVDRLEAQISLITFIIDHGVGQPIQKETDDLTAKLQAVVDRAKNATEEPKEITASVTPKTEEAPTAAEEPPPEPAEPVKPSVTLAQIQQKVVQLAAGFGGAKKAAIRDIINTYAKKVSDLPEDKWDEVWSKLTALEKED